MGTMQTQKTEKDHHVFLPNNSFIPPSGDVCFINNLPPELLSRIFEVGTADNYIEDEGDVTAYSDYVRYNRLDAEDDDDSDIPHDVKMTEELADDDGEGEEEEADNEGSDTTGSSLSWPPFQAVVFHVCHHWRNIAFSTPSLWTTIVVGPEARPPYHYVSTRLERSKDLPIDIYIDCVPRKPTKPDATDGGTPSDADHKFLYSLLIPHIHRWRTIEVTVLEYRHMHVFLSAVSDPSISAAPRLTTLTLEPYDHEEMGEFDNFRYPSISKHFILFGGSAPCLTIVVLWGVHVDWNQPWIASASKLTYLELAFHPEDVRPSWAQFATILRGASALERFNLCMSGPSGDPPAWFIEPTPGGPIDLNAPIQLPNVTGFIFAFHSPARSIGLLRKIYLPALKNLVLDFDNGDYTEFVHELAGPATSLTLPSTQEQPRSLLMSLERLKITKLAITQLPFGTQSLLLFYDELQNLTSLNINISYTDLSSLLLYNLTIPSERGGILLPRLVTLYVSGTTSGKALRMVVQARRDAGVPLNSLYVLVEEYFDLEEEDTKWLEENVETFDFFEEEDFEYYFL